LFKLKAESVGYSLVPCVGNRCDVMFIIFWACNAVMLGLWDADADLKCFLQQSPNLYFVYSSVHIIIYELGKYKYLPYINLSEMYNVQRYWKRSLVGYGMGMDAIHMHRYGVLLCYCLCDWCTLCNLVLLTGSHNLIAPSSTSTSKETPNEFWIIISSPVLLCFLCRLTIGLRLRIHRFLGSKSIYVWALHAWHDAYPSIDSSPYFLPLFDCGHYNLN
jgi:hypothetical protein